MPAIYHEGSWLGNATDPEVLVKDTVGWTGKNKLKITFDDVKEATGATGTWSGRTCTIGSLTITINEDMTVTLNGSHTSDVTFVLHNRTTANNNIKAGTYKFLAEGSTNKYFTRFFTTRNNSAVVLGDINSNTSEITADVQASDIMGVLINYTANTSISNVTIKPMIVEPSITDETYEPYHESVEVMYEEEVHGVNLLKNEATTQTLSGITYTISSDNKSVSTAGISTGSNFIWLTKNLKDILKVGNYYKLSGCPEGGGGEVYRIDIRKINSMGGSDALVMDTGRGATFQYTQEMADNTAIGALIRIANGQNMNGKVFYPMLRKADIDDPTYRPYNYQAIQNQLNAQGVLGAKNLLQNKGIAQTVSGVTFTLNADGSVTANGTATAAIAFNLSGNILDRLDPTRDYILSGCPKSGSASTYRIYVGYNPGNGNLGNDYGDGVRFSLSSTSVTYTAITIYIFISSGAVLNNLTFYPMLRLASDPDDTYQPYAMTNRELTEEKINIADLKTVVSASSDFADFKTRIASL